MAEVTRRAQIIAALAARLEVITIRAGYATNVGALLFINETPALGAADPDEAVAMVIQDDEVGHQAEKVVVTLPIELQALAKASLEEPWLNVEAVLGDIKRAVELPDRTLGGLLLRQWGIQRGTTRTLPREDGSLSVGIGLTYRLPYYELWGEP